MKAKSSDRSCTQQLFKIAGRSPSNRRVRTNSVVESFNISKDIVLCLLPGAVVVQMNQLTFQTAEEVLRDSVVVGIALSGHTLLNSQLFQTEAKSSGSILYASVAVEDQPFAWMLPGYCHIQGIQSKLCVDPVGEKRILLLFWYISP